MEQSTSLVTLENDTEVKAFFDQAVGLREYAEDLVILTAEDLAPVTNDLSVIAKVKKGMKDKRESYVKPLKDRAAEFIEAFKILMAPVEKADSILREKMLTYNKEQERIRQEQEEINRLRIEAANKEMALKGELTESVDLVEVAPEAPKRVSTDMGTVGQRDNWKYEVIDFALVPDEYKMINPAVLTPAAKSYKDTRTIPGVRIFNEPIIAVRTR